MAEPSLEAQMGARAKRVARQEVTRKSRLGLSIACFVRTVIRRQAHVGLVLVLLLLPPTTVVAIAIFDAVQLPERRDKCRRCCCYHHHRHHRRKDESWREILAFALEEGAKLFAANYDLSALGHRGIGAQREAD